MFLFLQCSEFSVSVERYHSGASVTDSSRYKQSEKITVISFTLSIITNRLVLIIHMGRCTGLCSSNYDVITVLRFVISWKYVENARRKCTLVLE